MFTPERKLSIVLEGLKQGHSKRIFAAKYHIHENNYYNWKKILLTTASKVFKGTFTLLHKDVVRQMDLVIANQKKLIDKQKEMIQVYSKIVQSHGLTRKYKRFSINEKKEIISAIEKSGISYSLSLRKLGISKSSYYQWKSSIKENPDGIKPRYGAKRKYEIEEYKEALFSILHAPPKDFGFNRTTWRMKDLHSVMQTKNLPIGKNSITRIIKNEGYRFLKAKKVLTSTDPNYKRKLLEITGILSSLKENEKFFSIDEFGPFAVKIQGGKSLVPPGQYKTYPQFQKSKGCLILTGALELSTNQMTHFYSLKKDTEEMIKLLDILLTEYDNEEAIYLSWDAASWHASKKLNKKVDEWNSSGKKPMVKLAPLPACAQFLNVIESVFSGMARAIIHNSNYKSVDECKSAIDRYFGERNNHFKINPKRAGNKLWGKEKVEPVFKETNNCKDPKYR